MAPLYTKNNAISIGNLTDSNSTSTTLLGILASIFQICHRRCSNPAAAPGLLSSELRACSRGPRGAIWEISPPIFRATIGGWAAFVRSSDMIPMGAYACCRSFRSSRKFICSYLGDSHLFLSDLFQCVWEPAFILHFLHLSSRYLTLLLPGIDSCS